MSHARYKPNFFYMIYMDIMLSISLRLSVPFHEGSYLSRLHAALIGRRSERNLEPSSKAMLLWKSEALETKVLSFFIMLETHNYPAQLVIHDSSFHPQ